MDGSFNLYEVWLDYETLGVFDSYKEAVIFQREYPGSIIREIYG